MSDRPHRHGLALAVVLGYVVLFVTLDTLARLFEVAPGVSLWYPSAGLNLALLLVFGRRYASLIFLATLGSGLLITIPALPIIHLVLPSLFVTIGNVMAADWLRRRLPNLDLSSIRAVWQFVLVAFLLPAVVSTLSVVSYTVTGMPGYTWEALPVITFQWWTGDVVGLLTLSPLLLIAARRLLPTVGFTRIQAPETYPSASVEPRSRVVFLVEMAGLLAVLYLVFAFWENTNLPLYLCFVPLLWIAIRYGLPRTTVAVFLLNLGAMVLLALHSTMTDATIGDAQLYMVVLALTGLFLGALVSERRQALTVLEQTCRTLEFRLEQHTHTLGEVNRTLVSQMNHHQQAEHTLQQYAQWLQDSGDRMVEYADLQAQLNKRLSASEQELKTMQERKDQFISLISHDLRSMLASVISFTEIIQRDAHSMSRSLIEEFAGHANFSVRNMHALLNNLLQWAQLQLGTATLQLQRIDLRRIAEDKVRVLSAEAHRKQIRLSVQAEGSLYARADEYLIGSVLHNLISNAIKFTKPDGQVTVSGHVHDATVEITVVDTGIGIPADRLETLFNPEKPQATPDTEGTRSTGVGLMLSKQIIEQHEGELRVESTPGQGSTFRFTLPRPTSEAPNDRPARTLAPSSSSV